MLYCSPCVYLVVAFDLALHDTRPIGPGCDEVCYTYNGGIYSQAQHLSKLVSSRSLEVLCLGAAVTFHSGLEQSIKVCERLCFHVEFDCLTADLLPQACKLAQTRPY